MTASAGSLTERSPGVWRLRVYRGRNPITGAPLQASRTFRGTEPQARKALARLVTEVEDGKFNPSTATFGEVLDRWLLQIEGESSPSTIRDYKGAIEHAIRPALGSVRLTKLGAADLDAWYRHWLTEEVKAATEETPPAYRSTTTVRKYHAIISAALGQAVKWGWRDSNPAKKASPPSARRTAMAVPSPAELQQMVQLGEAREPALGTAIALAALTGCRRGELCALRWTDISGSTLTVGRSVTVLRREVVQEGPTKTHQVRTVSLDPLALAVLEQRRREVERVAAYAHTKVAPNGYVLSGRPDGTNPLRPDTLTHWFGTLMTDMGLPYHLHQLRHFSATTLIAAGVDVRTVAGRLGHADASTTLRVYAHALEAQDKIAAEVLGKALTPAAS